MREKITRLAQHLMKNNKVYTEKDPEYYVFADILTDDQADVLLVMERRREEKVEDIASRIGKSYAETFEMLMQLTDIGVIELKPQGDGTDRFELLIYLPGIFELMMLNREQAKAHPEIARAFEEYSRVSVEPVTQLMPMGNGALRVIPVESAIKSETRKASYEEISHWLTKYQNHIALAPCQCRLVRQQMGEGTGNMPEELCIILGATAESCIRTGKARRITKEEAEEVVKKAERRGYMHQVTNMDGTDKIWALCNCERNICFALRTSQYFGTPNMSRSNYIAEVDPKKCAACGQCVETCPANAVKLGQNLCTKEAVTYLPKVLPDDHNWGPDRYNPDFRTNYENTYASGSAPCKSACPAHVSVQGYIKLASQGKYLDALELIKKENPFPAVCGRICPHNCENECTRGSLDEPVAIDEIKKFIAEQELKEETRFVPEKLFDYSDKKIAVIGAGPAGLSCAFYLAQKGYTITVFEKQEKLGGMLTLGIPSYRLEKDVLEAEIEVLRKLGVTFKTGVEVGKDITIDELRKEGYHGFYLAIGAQGGRKLNIEGDDNENVIAGVDFLRDVNLGKAVKTEGNVVVIGGGNVAVDVARTAVRTGASSVSMFCLEGEKEMPAQAEEVAEAKEEKVAVNNGWGPKRIIIENGKVTGVEFKRCLSVFNEEKRFAPLFDEKDTKIVPADKVLLSIGQSIEWGDLLKGSKVEVNLNGTVVADSFTYQTGEEDIFAGGDVFTGPKFAIDAIAAGKEGADSLHRGVQEGQTLHLGRNRRIFDVLDKYNVEFSGYDKAKRASFSKDSKKKNTFSDPRITLTEEQIKTETGRCLECGIAHVDINQCLGCGECTVRCKFDAITLKREYDAYSFGYENIKKNAIKVVIKRKIKIAMNPNRDSKER
ncbi:FAD-dependent oxidoreductase [Anaerocolumna xylanovorans]|uniref:NADPH-dependent glutamate synthase beta chain n=1 Tax=Anaerocolumna xylanovorans DSM 12503 TaxID=1121345 RepID=A0A1M7XZZ5_9FIRM|nr:FAD-dependent oxidoreductase [Anaerocolumna xylanovorans]SHO44684.1 NADPH-dependent glutamate synthase beta chain [Anaerocolumna xylanovorans DSM 12503]